MEDISRGLGSVDAAVAPHELSQRVFGRGKGRSHLEVYAQIQGSVCSGCAAQSLLAD